MNYKGGKTLSHFMGEIGFVEFKYRQKFINLNRY